MNWEWEARDSGVCYVLHPDEPIQINRCNRPERMRNHFRAFFVPWTKVSFPIEVLI
jgi:hypothetical protein